MRALPGALLLQAALCSAAGCLSKDSPGVAYRGGDITVGSDVTIDSCCSFCCSAGTGIDAWTFSNRTCSCKRFVQTVPTIDKGATSGKCAGIMMDVGSDPCSACAPSKDCATCASPLPTPPPVVPTPAPPLFSGPCIRFGHAYPADHTVDVQFIQTEGGDGAKTWANYTFGQFSDWTSFANAGKGSVIVWERTSKGRGDKLFEVDGVPLTPGPMLVLFECDDTSNCPWPPSKKQQIGQNIEPVAASYTPIHQGAKGRLFNVLYGSDPIKGLNMKVGGADVSSYDGVKYSLGSTWETVDIKSLDLDVIDGKTGNKLASDTYTPQPAPDHLGVFTGWAMGDIKQTGKYGPKLVVLEDAPDGNVCSSM